VRYGPIRGVEVRVAYGAERDRGHRPFPTASFTGLTAPGATPNPFLASIVELPSPVDFVTHLLDSSVEYHASRWFVRLSEQTSVFVNEVDALQWDNPFQTSDALGAGARGRLALPPDNQAHAIAAAGGAELPLRTRLTGTFAYGWMLQDDDFLPPTINPAVPAGPPPRRSLDGRIDTVLANVVASSRPHRALTLTARYHLYDLDNRSGSLAFGDYVVADAVRGMLRRSLPYSYSKNAVDVDAALRPLRQGSLKVRYGWQRWHREHREVRNSDEYHVGPTLDLAPASWLSLRGAYTHAVRDPQEYDALAGRESDSPALYNPLLRKFDEARRVRDQVTTLAMLTLDPRLELTGSFALADDAYSRSAFGLQDDSNFAYSVDLGLAPVERIRFYGNFTREEHRFHQRVGLGPIGKGSYLGRGQDTIDTWGAGLRASVLPEIDFDFQYSLSLGVSRLRAAASSAEAEAGDFPNVRTKLHQFSALCSYALRRDLTLRLGYAFERYESSDFAVDGLEPFVPSPEGPKDSIRPPSLFLGARTPDGGYDAHVGTVALRYEF